MIIKTSSVNGFRRCLTASRTLVSNSALKDLGHKFDNTIMVRLDDLTPPAISIDKNGSRTICLNEELVYAKWRSLHGYKAVREEISFMSEYYFAAAIKSRLTSPNTSLLTQKGENMFKGVFTSTFCFDPVSGYFLFSSLHNNHDMLMNGYKLLYNAGLIENDPSILIGGIMIGKAFRVRQVMASVYRPNESGCFTRVKSLPENERKDLCGDLLRALRKIGCGWMTRISYYVDMNLFAEIKNKTSTLLRQYFNHYPN